MAHVAVIDGDLLDQDVEVIVNAWNRNIIPWWLLLPRGVSGGIKRRGTQPVSRAWQERPDSIRRRRRDQRRQAAVQGDHSRRRY